MLDVFKWMAAVGRVAPEEMARTFNLGIGMVVVVDQADANEAVQVCWSVVHCRFLCNRSI